MSAPTSWASGRWQQGFAALITAILLWAQASVYPAASLDSSWQAGLALARLHDLQWGPQVLFTYGPLGFLQNSAYYSYGQSFLATLYQPLVLGALFLGIAAALRQRQSPMTSLLGAFVATAVIALLHIGHGSAPGLEYPELALLGSFAWSAVPLLQQNTRPPAAFSTCIGLGVAAGLQLLIKFNIGLGIMLIALALSVLLDWRAVGRHCATVAAFAASTVFFWLLAGQQLRNLPDWVRYSGSVLTGYSEAMGVALNVYTAGSLMLSVTWMLALVVMFIRDDTRIPRRLLALVGLVTAICARAALGRSDIWHFYVLVGIIITATAVTPFPRNWRRAIVILTAIIVVGNSLGMTATGYGAYDQLRLALQAPRQGLDRLITMAIPSRLDQRIEQAKEHQRTLFAVPDQFLTKIGASTVHIDPSQTSAAWAYNLSWSPAPVFQTYQANTPTLDGLNSKSITSGPQFVLSRLSPATPATGHDGRLGVQESPQYSRALLCNYSLAGIAKQWALFIHTSPHCGPLTPLSQVEVHSDDAVPVPKPSGPDMAVLVGIELHRNLIDRLFQGTVAPLMVPTVRIDNTAYRLIGTNAAEPFLVSSPDTVAGTNLQIDAQSIGIGRAPSLARSDVAATLRFYEMRTTPAVSSPGLVRVPRLTAHSKTVIDSYGRWFQVIDHDGDYLVGVDVFPGKYRNTGGTMCRWARLGGSDPNDAVAGDSSSSPQEIELLLSDTRFLTQNCGTWQWLLPNEK